MTVPNLITILRIILAPTFIIYMINHRASASLVIFIIASVSDALDGFIARVFHQKSNLGAYLDPLADKILLMSSYVILAIFKMIPSWLAVLTISRDVIILLGVLVLYLNHCPVKINPSLLSKATTSFPFILFGTRQKRNGRKDHLLNGLNGKRNDRP